MLAVAIYLPPVQEVLKNWLCDYLSEETGMHHNGDSDWEWVVDPLDGTNNYSQGLPMYCVSIGVRYKGETQVGVVYAPSFDSLYTAIRGEGAHWNGKQIHVTRKNDLNECIVATGFPYDKATVGQDKNNLDNVCRMLPQVRCTYPLFPYYPFVKYLSQS